MLINNSDKIRSVKGNYMLQPGGKKGRPKLLHNGINGNKGGKNRKGTPKNIDYIENLREQAQDRDFERRRGN